MRNNKRLRAKVISIYVFVALIMDVGIRFITIRIIHTEQTTPNNFFLIVTNIIIAIWW